LTSHRDTVHTASSISGSTEYSPSAYKNIDNNAEPSVTLKNSPSQSKINNNNSADNDDELILKNSSSNNQNYFSLNSINTNIP
jgi:hypothetical protein